MRRERKGVSRREFARSIGVDHVSLWKIEEGKSNVKFDTLCKIADGLGIEVDDLFVDERQALLRSLCADRAQRRGFSLT